jgi:hypothetical protein
MFKKHKVVMLPTEKAENCLIRNESGNKSLWKNNPKGHYFTQEYLKSVPATSHHLYILSDDEIKEGDWYIDTYSAIPLKASENHINKHSTSKKIIATTDESLKWYMIGFLPQPSQSFIEKYIEEYNKGNVITDVLVEYEDADFDYINTRLQGKPMVKPVVKVNPKDNTITIKKVKDSLKEFLQKNPDYKEEVIELLHKRMRYTLNDWYDESTTLKWIKENL